MNKEKSGPEASLFLASEPNTVHGTQYAFDPYLLNERKILDGSDG